VGTLDRNDAAQMRTQLTGTRLNRARKSPNGAYMHQCELSLVLFWFGRAVFGTFAERQDNSHQQWNRSHN
jgi:hypothetical protein